MRAGSRSTLLNPGLATPIPGHAHHRLRQLLSDVGTIASTPPPPGSPLALAAAHLGSPHPRHGLGVLAASPETRCDRSYQRGPHSRAITAAARTMLVLGIGGSALGNIALQAALNRRP